MNTNLIKSKILIDHETQEVKGQIFVNNTLWYEFDDYDFDIDENTSVSNIEYINSRFTACGSILKINFSNGYKIKLDSTYNYFKIDEYLKLINYDNFIRNNNYYYFNNIKPTPKGVVQITFDNEKGKTYIKTTDTTTSLNTGKSYNIKDIKDNHRFTDHIYFCKSITIQHNKDKDTYELTTVGNEYRDPTTFTFNIAKKDFDKIISNCRYVKNNNKYFLDLTTLEALNNMVKLNNVQKIKCSETLVNVINYQKVA